MPFPGLTVGTCVVFLCFCYYLVTLICNYCFGSAGCVIIVAAPWLRWVWRWWVPSLLHDVCSVTSESPTKHHTSIYFALVLQYYWEFFFFLHTLTIYPWLAAFILPLKQEHAAHKAQLFHFKDFTWHSILKITMDAHWHHDLEKQEWE